MRLGVHVSIAGGLLSALERARELGCNTMQIFSRSPRGGAASPLTKKDVKRIHAGPPASGPRRPPLPPPLPPPPPSLPFFFFLPPPPPGGGVCFFFRAVVSRRVRALSR